MNALKIYSKLNNRRLTLEYILLKDVNDSKECAVELANLFKDFNAYVYLIPYNSVDEHGYKGVDYNSAMKFYLIFMK